jgi:hypothetical protein
MSTKPLRAITLAELEASKSSSVWVKNISNPKGKVNMTMSDGMGNNVVVVVPVTWIPLDLTTQAAKNSLIASPVFRRMLSMRMVQLISEADAEAEMDDPAAQKEASRVYSHAQESSLNDPFVPAAAKAAAVEGSGSISGFAMQLAIAKDMDEDQVLTTLRGSESSMSVDDFKYIAETSVFPRVKIYCAEKIVG